MPAVGQIEHQDVGGGDRPFFGRIVVLEEAAVAQAGIAIVDLEDQRDGELGGGPRQIQGQRPAPVLAKGGDVGGLGTAECPLAILGRHLLAIHRVPEQAPRAGARQEFLACPFVDQAGKIGRAIVKCHHGAQRIALERPDVFRLGDGGRAGDRSVCLCGVRRTGENAKDGNDHQKEFHRSIPLEYSVGVQALACGPRWCTGFSLRYS